MHKVVEKATDGGTAAKPAVRPISGELTLADLNAVVGGNTSGPITNGRFNPAGQKTRFGSSPG